MGAATGKAENVIKGSRVLITGGSGLIGSHTADALLKKGAAEVIVLDKFINEANLAQAKPSSRLRVVKGELGDPATVRGILKGVDYVYHFGTSAMAEEGQKNPRVIIDDINAFFEFLTAMMEFSVRKLIFSSSVAAYETPQNPEIEMTEETPLRGRSMYAAGKIAGEQFCRVFNGLYGMNYLTVRYSAVYGPRMHTKGYSSQIILRTLEAIKNRQPLGVQEGEDKEIQNYVYVEDVARANVLALKSPLGDTAFNIVGDTSVNVLDVAKTVMRLKGVEVPIKMVPRQKLSMPVRRFSGKKAAEMLGFVAATPISEGLKRTLKWYESKGY